MRIIRNVLLGLVVLAVLGVLAILVLSETKLRAKPAIAASQLAKPTPAQLADGARQLDVLGCKSCHGEQLQGKVFLDDPNVATIYAPNLTQVAARSTDAQLDHGIRQGIGHDGRALFVMPSEGYQFLTDSEAAALIAAIRAVPRNGSDTTPVHASPMGRLGLALGKFKNASELAVEFRANQPPGFGQRFARGRHIVLTNCAECHGPRLEGQQVEPGVVSPDLQIAGAYDLAQFRTMLRTGVPPSGRDIGLMATVAKQDFKHLTDDEIAAIHAYLVERAQRMN